MEEPLCLLSVSTHLGLDMMPHEIGLLLTGDISLIIWPRCCPFSPQYIQEGPSKNVYVQPQLVDKF